MPAQITYGDSGTNRTITAITYGDAGTNRTILAIYYGDAGTNRLVFVVALTAVAAPAARSAIGPTSTLVTPATTCTPSGGIPGYTYSWVLTSGAGITATTPTTASTTFTATGMAVGEVRNATFVCNVTDSTPQVAASNTVTVTIERT